MKNFSIPSLSIVDFILNSITYMTVSEAVDYLNSANSSASDFDLNSCFTSVTSVLVNSYKASDLIDMEVKKELREFFKI